MSNATPRRLTHPQVNAEALDRNAIRVVEQLQDNGFEAFLVGGCVRDLLCDQQPKDFDVATNATPEQVRSIFRRSRLVGRRFPIAHVRFGRHIIEVSTFRQGQHDAIELDASGMIVQDRAFGSVVDDAFRRDFTVNALYYDTQTHEIVDYVGGLDDLEERTLRFIGDPAERLAEDPVRMLRAIRFAAKLGFQIDTDILEHLDDTTERLEAIPKARLFDEFQKLFLSGYGADAWRQLRGTPIARQLFPTCNPDSELITQAMENTDQRIAQDQPVTPGFLIAVLLWDDFDARCEELNPQRKPGLMYDIAADTVAAAQLNISIPRRYSLFATDVWLLQDRLALRNPKYIQRIMHHKRFRAGFDFLCLRGNDDEQLAEIGRWWETIQEADTQQQQQMIEALPKVPNKKRRRRRKKKSSSQS